MKKAWNRMIALLLCLLMVSLEATLTVQVHAYEPDEDIAAYEDAVVEDLAVEADDETVTFVDFSDQIIQEGGFPEAKDGDQGHSDPDGDELYAVAAGDLAGAQNAIYEGLKKRSESIDVRSYNIKSADAFDVYISVINSHPELFYVKSEATTYSSGNTATRIEPKYNSSYTEQDSTAFSNKVNEILAGMDSDWSDLEKALYLHEWIVTHCEYDKTLSKRDAYTVIVGGSAVCQGYALAYEYLLQRTGIDGQVVTSNGINHAWNIISLNNKYYYVDCTWDDPSGADTLHCGHENFLRSRDMMYASESAGGTGHTSTDWIGSEDGMNLYQSVPGDSKYDGYFWSDITHRLPQAGHKTLTIGVTDGNAQGVMYDFGTESSKNYPVETKRWPASWNGGGYWIGYFYRTVAVGDTFYYSDPDSIYSITKDGAQNKVYTLTQVEEGKGYIYGLTAEGNVISYYLKQSPNSSDFTYTGTYTASSSGSIAVTGVALNKSNETISVGESLQFSATVSPSTATNKKVSWKSGNEAIATVTSGGLVKGAGAGKTVITVTTVDGGKTATCNITVNNIQQKVGTPTASPASGGKIAIGSKITLSTQTTGANIYYTLDGSAPSSSKTLYTGPITVSEADAGKTIKIKAIAVKDGYDNSDVAEFSYTVNNSQARVEFSKNSIKLEKKGATETLTATVYKADGTIDSSAYVSYKSSNTGVAIVSSTGVVTAVANGTATITATSGQTSATCLVTVDIPKTKTPTANPAGGSKIAIGSSVTLSTQTTGAKIYYTLNGSTPSTSSTLYTGPITVSESYAGQTLKIKAIAVKDGYDNSDIAEFSYTVNNSQARIELSKDSIKLEKKGATLSLAATVYKADGSVDSSASVSYKSSNTNVATVSSSGVVTAVANGNATITATSGQMNATCLVTVDIPKEKVESPTANPASGSELAIGNKVVLGCKTEGAKIYYTKDGKDPASYGTLYSSPIEIGETDAGKSITIRAYAKKDGCDDSDPVQFKYTVKEDQARIELSKDSIKLEEKDATETLKATVYKADGSKDTSASVSYKSSNTKVATVSQTGVVTAVENGEATITATSGELSATCLVTVEISKEKVEAPTANPASGKKIAIGSSISLSTLTDGAKIYYTLDGSEPSSTKTLYSKPITIEKEYAGQTLKIKAIALKEDFEDSDISEFEYTVDESQARIELSKDSIKFEEKDATEKLTAIVYGADGKEDKEAVVNYRSSNSRIASVSNDGIVTAGENGVATITATYEELTAECIVTVDVKEEEPEPEPEEDKEFKVEGISDGGYPYTGLAITPSVSVYYGDTLLSEGTDYKLGYKNNKLASDGAPEVTVTLAGNYSGTINVPFKILKKNITDQDVVVANTTSVYNGKSQKLKPALYYMGKAVSNKEYRIIGLSSSGYKEPGDYPITFTAELGGNFTGTINTNISIKENTDMIDLAKAAFRLDDPSFSFVYDGNPKEPVYVANGLDRKDYYISYSNNVAIGKATAMISAVPGSGSCYGTKTINFKITKPPVINISNDSNVRISLPDDPVPYAAGGACPKVSVTYAGEPLTEGADYKVSYRNNKNCGQAYVVITGKGAYKGRKEKPFTISKQNLDNLTLIASDVIYSNKIYAYQKTKLTLTDKDGKVLKAGKDYVKFKLGAASEGTVFKSPSSTPEVGSRITVTLTGTGNYTGDITATYYVIEKGRDLSKAKVKILATPEYKDGDPVTLKKEQIQVVFNGKTLSSGDFDIVSYSNNIKAGKGAKVTIRGKGIYGGLKTVGFTIAPKNYK